MDNSIDSETGEEKILKKSHCINIGSLELRLLLIFMQHIIVPTTPESDQWSYFIL